MIATVMTSTSEKHACGSCVYASLFKFLLCVQFVPSYFARQRQTLTATSETWMCAFLEWPVGFSSIIMLEMKQTRGYTNNA